MLFSGLPRTAAQVAHCPTPGGSIDNSVNGSSNKRHFILKSMTGGKHPLHSFINYLRPRDMTMTKYHLIEMISHQEINMMGIVHGAT